MWRGGSRLGISVSAPFVWRCLTGAALAPFPLLRHFRKGGGPALLQQHYGGTRFAVGATGFAVAVESDRGRAGRWIGRSSRRRLCQGQG